MTLMPEPLFDVEGRETHFKKLKGDGSSRQAGFVWLERGKISLPASTLVGENSKGGCFLCAGQRGRYRFYTQRPNRCDISLLHFGKNRGKVAVACR
jgi:hypothetical protein